MVPPVPIAAGADSLLRTRVQNKLAEKEKPAFPRRLLFVFFDPPLPALASVLFLRRRRLVVLRRRRAGMRSVLMRWRRRLMRLALRTALVVVVLVVRARIAMVRIVVRAGVIRIVALRWRSERAESLVAPVRIRCRRAVRVRRRRPVRRGSRDPRFLRRHGRSMIRSARGACGHY